MRVCAGTSANLFHSLASLTSLRTPLYEFALILTKGFLKNSRKCQKSSFENMRRRTTTASLPSAVNGICQADDTLTTLLYLPPPSPVFQLRVSLHQAHRLGLSVVHGLPALLRVLALHLKPAMKPQSHLLPLSTPMLSTHFPLQQRRILPQMLGSQWLRLFPGRTM